MLSATRSIGGFQRAFEACGGQIIQKIWPPLGTKDFGPYIPTIKADADAIFSLMVGPMSLQFPKQLAASGNKKPVIGGGTSYDEFVLPSMGDEVIGHVSALQYSAALETPKNEAFVKKYRAKYGKVPSYYSETNYTTAQMIHEVIKNNNGNFPGAEEFVKQLAAMKVDTIRGPVSIDEMRNPVQNIYIKKVEKKKMFGYDKDELWNTVIKTYPNVNQFGQFNKDEFLKTPVYSRDYPALQILQLSMIPKADTGFRTRSCSGSKLDHRPGLGVRRARFFDLRSGMGISVTSDTPTNGGQPVLELNGLSKSFGGLQAVRGVTLKIMPGDRKAIIGPNGAGKTTLFNLITGIFPATSGQVLLFGRDVTRWPSHRRTALGMARTFQITSLFPRLTVLDNVLLAIQGLRRRNS